MSILIKRKNNMKKIYVMGNLLVEKDSLPIKILPDLKKKLSDFDFIELDPSEDFPKQKTLTIIDTVLDIKKVTLVKEIDKIQLEKICSLHDFDLGYNLKLMKKFGMIEKVNIVGVPTDIDDDEAVKQIKEVITSLFSKNE